MITIHICLDWFFFELHSVFSHFFSSCQIEHMIPLGHRPAGMPGNICLALLFFHWEGLYCIWCALPSNSISKLLMASSTLLKADIDIMPIILSGPSNCWFSSIWKHPSASTFCGGFFGLLRVPGTSEDLFWVKNNPWSWCQLVGIVASLAEVKRGVIGWWRWDESWGRQYMHTLTQK